MITLNSLRSSARALTMVTALLVLAGAARDAGAQPYAPPASARATTNLSGSWKFTKGDVPDAEAPAFNDAAWSTVAVPHTWNNVDGQDGPNSGGGAFGREYYRGVGTYRRHLQVPGAYAGRRLYLQFDGASLVATVWVNGSFVGRHEGGFTRFRFDVTAVLDTSAGNDNVITVKVDNANFEQIPPISGDFTVFGGIYRDVSLVATDPVATDLLDFGSAGVYLSQTAVSQTSATVRIKTMLANATGSSAAVTVRSVIVDAQANVVQTVATAATLAANSSGSTTQTVTIPSPRLWDGLNDPYLYSVHVEIHQGSETGPVRDVVPPQPLGLRYFSVDANQGFRLNGRYLDLHGVNRHQDRLNKGWAISQADQDEDMSLIREIGATAIRLAHYPHAPYFYGLADTNGLVVWAEIPVIDRVADQPFTANARQQLIEMIRQHYNHPSIVFWGVANEARYPPDPNPLLIDLNALAKQEDPYRLTTLAHCCLSETDPITTRTDTLGYNKYLGWYEWNYDAFGYWADLTHTNNPTKTFSISEYGAGASIFLHAQNPPLSLSNHTEEYQALFHEAHWLQMKTRPFIWGKFVWNMFDFAVDSRTEGDTDGRNDKGLVTYDRQTRKDAFYWYKANWTTAPMVYITSRRWTQRTTPTTEVKVYSNAEAVELRVNGVSLGRTVATNTDRIFRWTNVNLQSGLNAVEAIAAAGTTTVTDAVAWNVGAPRVTIARPLPGEIFTAPGTIAITATADASVSAVEFFRDDVKLGEDTNGTDGWSLQWTGVPAGSYLLTARSRDAAGLTTVSPEVRVAVDGSGNVLPTVSLVTPAAGATYPFGTDVTLVAAASDADGTVEKVTFYQGGIKLREDGSGADGWRTVVTGLQPGNYSFTAVASDNLGAIRISTAVPITVTGSADQPPTVATPASATPAIVTGTSAVLRVLGADDGGEPSLTYTWATTGTTPAPVTFSGNGTNQAKTVTASFARAGLYTFEVVIRDVGGRTATSSVGVTVTPTAASIQVSPASAVVTVGGTQPFTATVLDQFATPLGVPPSITWTATGGTIASSGVFTAGAVVGSFSVSAASGGRTGSAAVTVAAAGSFSAHINFQPAAAPTVTGYLVDSGAVFASRGNGLSYGWSADNTTMARDRNHPLSPDQRYDTLLHMGTLTWEIAVPNGTYRVTAVVGDPGYYDVNSRLTVEGIATATGTTSATSPWLQGTTTVTVSDGRLTLANDAGSYNKICFVGISAAGPVNQAPAVSLTAPASGATFTAPATIAIAASASDPDGTVTRVEFFDDSTKLGEDTNGSDGWSFSWLNVLVGSHRLSARATDNQSATTTSTVVTIAVNAAATAIRIDVGSAVGYVDGAGHVWQPDQFAAGGTVSSKPDSIGNTTDDDLYRTYRYGSFSYAIPVANGTYDVYLQFIEPWWNLPGQRIFLVNAEGLPRLANLDLFALAGKFNALERTFAATVTDGVLDLSFTPLLDNAIVSGIVLVRQP